MIFVKILVSSHVLQQQEMLQLSFWVLCINLLVQVTTHFMWNSTSSLVSSLRFLRLFYFADIKGFLADVKPALLSALDTEYEKNPFEV